MTFWEAEGAPFDGTVQETSHCEIVNQNELRYLHPYLFDYSDKEDSINKKESGGASGEQPRPMPPPSVREPDDDGTLWF